MRGRPPRGTRLPGCAKLYLPLDREPSAAPYGFVFELIASREPKLAFSLRLLAFGERHPRPRTRTRLRAGAQAATRSIPRPIGTRRHACRLVIAERRRRRRRRQASGAGRMDRRRYPRADSSTSPDSASFCVHDPRAGLRCRHLDRRPRVHARPPFDQRPRPAKRGHGPGTPRRRGAISGSDTTSARG